MQQRKGCLPAFIYTVLILGLFIAGIGLSQCRNDTEARFSGSSQPGDAVYGDIVSIVPSSFWMHPVADTVPLFAVQKAQRVKSSGYTSAPTATPGLLTPMGLRPVQISGKSPLMQLYASTAMS